MTPERMTIDGLIAAYKAQLQRLAELEAGLNEVATRLEALTQSGSGPAEGATAEAMEFEAWLRRLSPTAQWTLALSPPRQRRSRR